MWFGFFKCESTISPSIENSVQDHNKQNTNLTVATKGRSVGIRV